MLTGQPRPWDTDRSVSRIVATTLSLGGGIWPKEMSEMLWKLDRRPQWHLQHLFTQNPDRLPDSLGHGVRRSREGGAGGVGGGEVRTWVRSGRCGAACSPKANPCRHPKMQR